MVNEILITREGLNNMLNAGYLGQISVPTKINVGIGTTAPTEGNTSLTKRIPISGTESVDDCDTSDWTDSTDASSTLNTVLFKEGSASLTVEKDGTSGTEFYVEKTTTSVNFTSKDFWAWIYLVDTDDLDSSTTMITIRFGSDDANYYYLDLVSSNLVDGWNAITFNSTNATGSVGSPTLASSDYTRFTFNTTLAAGIISSDRILIDDIKVASSTDYDNALDSGYPQVIDSANEVEMESTLGTTKANGYPINEMGHLNASSTLYSHSVFTAENKTSSDIFIMKERIKLINTL